MEISSYQLIECILDVNQTLGFPDEVSQISEIFDRNMHITIYIITLDRPCVHTVSHTVQKIKES